MEAKMFKQFVTSSLLFCLQLIGVWAVTTRAPTTRRFGPLQGFQVEVGQSWESGTRQGTTGISAEGCAEICGGDAQCRSFDYNKKYKECFTHTYNTCEVTNRRACAVCDHYKKINSNLACVTAAPPPGTVPTTNTDFVGKMNWQTPNGIKASGTFPSLQDCLQYCTARANCDIVDYNTADLTCWYHTTCAPSASCGTCTVQQYIHKYRGCGDQLSPTPSINTPGIPTTDDGTFGNDVRPGISYGGGTLLGTYPNHFVCQDKCYEKITCQGVDYHKNTKECLMHTSLTVCGTTYSCPTCTHYKRKTAWCYVESITTTAAPTPSTPAPISSKFPIVYTDKKIDDYESIGTYRPATGLENCLVRCDEISTCEAAMYIVFDGYGVCFTFNNKAACSDRSAARYTTIYLHARVTCGDKIFQDFNAPLLNKKRQSGTFKGTHDIVSCLKMCGSSANCGGVNYNGKTERCEHMITSKQCGKILNAADYVHYAPKSLACVTGYEKLVEKKRITVVDGTSIKTATKCLEECKKRGTCGAVNHRPSDNRCEYVTRGNACRNLVGANAYNFYKRNNVNCGGGAVPTTTTTTAQTTIEDVRGCWASLKESADGCNKPQKNVANIENMDKYCRDYNDYFECVLAEREDYCAGIPRINLAVYVQTLEDVKFRNTVFCKVFSEDLKDCLEQTVVKNEINKCHPIKPSNVRDVQTKAPCERLRDYDDCILSVVDYRCKDWANEYYQKSTKNILHERFSNCALMSKPRITSVNAIYGPAKGGSSLIIKGRTLQKVITNKVTQIQVMFDNVQPCSSTGKRDNYITCLTKTATSINIAKDQLVTTRLKYTNPSVYFTAGNFTYKDNPTVTSLEPSRIVQGGGTKLYVTGSNLYYVVTPTLLVYTRISPSVPAPAYEIPCERNNDESIEEDKRNLICDAPDIPDQVDPGQELKDVYYHTGLKLDGITEYSVLTHYGISTGDRLSVYGPPEIKQTPDKTYEFRVFWPVLQKTIDIPGEYLDTAATSRDYTVQIDMTSCTNVKITSTIITCEPPQENPYGNKTAPPIIVKAPGPDHEIGVKVGMLEYQTNIFDNETAKYSLIGAAVATVVLLVILIVICCFCCTCCPCYNRSSKGYEESE